MMRLSRCFVLPLPIRSRATSLTDRRAFFNKQDHSVEESAVLSDETETEENGDATASKSSVPNVEDVSISALPGRRSRRVL